MKIAFYAPLKPPDHPVPSGDRQMARNLVRTLQLGGYDVEAVSRLRTYCDTPALPALEAAAAPERRRLHALWSEAGTPDLWLTYHPYYRAPDLLGPALSREFGIPYVTVEASYAGKRDRDAWRDMQATVVEAIRRASVNICFTATDREGLERLVPPARLADLAPFIAAPPCPTTERPDRNPVRLVTVAMMRVDAKLDSYRALARALAEIEALPWTLSIVGDGPARAEVRRCFEALPSARIEWMGEIDPCEIAGRLEASDIFVWPGIGEAYGLVYLEAQAAGLPVVAMNTHGVPAVVRDRETGLLTPAGDVAAYAAAIAQLIADHPFRARLGAAGRAFVQGERSIEAAASALARILQGAIRAEAAR